MRNKKFISIIAVMLAAIFTLSYFGQVDFFGEDADGDGYDDDVDYAEAGYYDTTAIGSDRQVLWDASLVDYTRTNAPLMYHQPNRMEDSFVTADGWQASFSWYHNICEYNGTYRMYYIGADFSEAGYPDGHQWRVCVCESKDGKEWYFPNVGQYEFRGSTDNNIVLEAAEGTYFDNFFVFVDTNPACKPEERFKAIGQAQVPYFGLGGWYSEDGYHWSFGGMVGKDYAYDSMNTVFWDEELGCYSFYVRQMEDGYWKSIYNVHKKDFWGTEEERLNGIQYTDVRRQHMYTNNVMKYYRAKSTYVAIPTRFSIQYVQWTYDYKEITVTDYMRSHPVTNSILMTSRDGHTFDRYTYGFILNGNDVGVTWEYGDRYCCYGMIETSTDVAGQDNRISLYMKELRGNNTCYFVRYELRLDGFVSYHADAEEKRVVTMPITFTGDEFKLNFSTSALGYVKVRMLDENFKPIEGFETGELYGDKVDRTISFKNGNIADLQGKTVSVELTFSDADVYSYIFE